MVSPFSLVTEMLSVKVRRRTRCGWLRDCQMTPSSRVSRRLRLKLAGVEMAADRAEGGLLLVLLVICSVIGAGIMSAAMAPMMATAAAAA